MRRDINKVEFFCFDNLWKNTNLALLPPTKERGLVKGEGRRKRRRRIRRKTKNSQIMKRKRQKQNSQQLERSQIELWVHCGITTEEVRFHLLHILIRESLLIEGVEGCDYWAKFD
jgi:deferrochelatase/peroxidase EfeB